MSNRPLLAGALLSLAVITAPVDASASEDAPAFSRCMEASGGVTVAMLDCIAAETALQDARLNREYRDTLAMLSSGQQARLRTAQRSWVQYRDADCGFWADPDGGTAASLAVADCVRRMTAERASDVVRLRPEH
ncbi:MAG: lysozyme inhibitor LprI family protein [Luteimonas sp.]